MELIHRKILIMNLREIYTILREKFVLKSITSELSFIKHSDSRLW